MKHKFLTVLLALVAAFCLCFGLAACGDTPQDPAGGTQTEQGGADGPENDGGDQGGDKETDGDENPDEDGSEDDGGDEQPDEGGGQGGSEEEGGNTPDEGGSQGGSGGQGGSEGEGGNTPDEGGSEDDGGDEQPDEGGGHETSHTHNFTGYEYNNDATCERDGTETGHCTCGENDTRTKTGTALGHVMTFYAGTATCISAGTIDHWNCSRCKRNFADDTGDTELYTIESEPLPHQITAENKCKWYDICGTEWEYTEGLYYDYDEATGTYAVRAYQNVSGDVVIPYGYQGKFVTKIKQSAFLYNGDITSITISGSVQTIELGAFQMNNGNSLEHITVAKDNPNYKSEQECLIEKETNTLILGCKNSVIPNSVTAIGSGAFYNCSELTDITIPNGITAIGDSAFYTCSELMDITIPDSVTSIGGRAFEGTAYYNDPSHWDADGVLYIDDHLIQAKTTLSGDYTVRAGTKTIAAWAFSDAAWALLSSLSGNYEYGAEEVCSDLMSITIPDSVVTIGRGGFEDCRGLKTITIGRGVTAIGARVFSLCTGLESITVDVNNSSYSSQDGILYNKEQTEIVHVPKAIKGEVTIPNGVTEISSAFYSRDGLTDITIPASVTIIEWQAFEKCSGLNSITFNGKITIGDFVFEDCTNLTAVYISDLTAWCNSIFSVATINISNPLALAHHLYLDGQEVTDLTIPNGITQINVGAFYGCIGLKSLTVPDSVISIDELAFYECTELENIIIPNSVSSIGVLAFEGTAYYNDPSHWDSDGVLYIGNHLIKAKTTLSGEYTVRAGTRTIAGNAFAQCETLTEVTIPNGVVSIGSVAFSRCVNLTKITIPISVTVIGYEAFGNGGELIDIQFMGTVKEWQEICKGEYPYDTDMNWSWDSGTSDYTITCTDGTVDKKGKVTYFEG